MKFSQNKNLISNIKLAAKVEKNIERDDSLIQISKIIEHKSDEHSKNYLKLHPKTNLIAYTK